MRNARILLLAITALASMGATLLPGPAAAQATPAAASVGERAASSADARSQCSASPPHSFQYSVLACRAGNSRS